MPMERLVLILICVVAAAGVTVWLGGMLAAALNVGALIMMILPLTLILSLFAWVVRDRLESPKDDHYDLANR